ncbi:MAG: CpsB/CapC family capsule biosynthesis tyrosine phosphatase [Bryobacteraceae bacterium]|jgi:protein-tyrosine phosphatase
MIDIHSHILPGLDDGAVTPEEALAMLRMAAAAGTTDIVASPHANQEFAFDPATVEHKIAELQEAAGNTPRIHFGCDLQLTTENIEDALRWPGKYSINHRGYLLVEFSDFLIPRTSGEIFARMIAAGLRPIVTHPERNPLLREKVTELEAWVRQGCLVQVTAQSLLGRFGKSAKAAGDHLIARGLVHLLASDAHDLKLRPPVLDEAHRYAQRTFGAEAARWLLLENPRAVLAGASGVTAAMPVRRKKWFSFW